MTALTKAALWPNPTQATRLVDPVAFILALILSPIIVGILGSPLLLVPTFAIIVGGPAYLLIGTPLLWAALRRGHTDPDHFFRLGLMTIGVIAIPAIAVTASLQAANSNIETAISFAFYEALFAAICAAMAAVWGLTFASLYRRFRNPNFPA